MKCNIHHDPLKVYCDTCEEVICRDCTVTKQHRNHDYNLITESYPKHHQQIEANLTTVKKKVADNNTALTNLITREKEVTKQGEDVKKEIHTQAQLITNIVQQSERQLVQQVDTAVQQKIQLLMKQREEAETVLNQLKGCEEFVEQSMKVRSQQQILREKQSLVQVMATVNQDVNPVVYQPIEAANVIFIRSQTLVDIHKGIGEIKSKTFGKSVVIKNAYYVDKKATVTLKLQTHDDSPFSIPLSLISCILSSASDSQLIPCDMNEIQTGIYEISFTPQARGKYQLIVKLGGVDITGSPFTLPVVRSPEKIGKPVNIISGLVTPVGVAVTQNEEIIVVESRDYCVTILNKEGKKLRSLGKGKTKYTLNFQTPCGVAISHDGHILATDLHQIRKLTFEGDCVASFGGGSYGFDNFYLNWPEGIAVHPTTGQIFLADAANNRIQVFSNDLTYLNSFGQRHKSMFKFPSDVTFDNEGYLYVVDRDHSRIIKLTSTGQYISQIGSQGSNPGQLFCPSSIIIDNNLVYVTDWGNDRISIFDTNGCFIHCFGKYGSGEGEFNGVCGITIDSLGNLYVSDAGNNRLVIF